jgi:putative YphP/YqiW family bacilliredoxin
MKNFADCAWLCFSCLHPPGLQKINFLAAAGPTFSTDVHINHSVILARRAEEPGQSAAQLERGFARTADSSWRRTGAGKFVTLCLTVEEEAMYSEIMVTPMREELTRLGIQELRTAEEVDGALAAQPGISMVVVNSICGCAAGRMRPAIRLALRHSLRPDRIFSVFAGQDQAATERARSYFTGYPPSSPSIAFLREGRLIHMIERSDIEHREAADIALELKQVFDTFCGQPQPSVRQT